MIFPLLLDFIVYLFLFVTTFRGCSLAISTTTAGAVKNTVKGIRDAKAAKEMPEDVPTKVPKIEEPNLAEIEKQADLEGEFYEDIFESQRADIPEYEDYLSDLAEASSERPGRAPEMGGESGSKGTGNITKNLDTNNIPNMTKQEIIDTIPDNWKYTEHNGFVHIKDEAGKIRIRIDPPDKVTQYPHVHVYDNDGNLLDGLGNIVDRKSPSGHIPYKN